MAFNITREYLKKMGLEGRTYTFEVSSATVGLTASAVECGLARIAKTLSSTAEGRPMLVVAVGDAKVGNHKYKEQLKTKAKMLSPDEVADLVGRSVGGMCPFGVKEGVRVYLDESLKHFDTVYPTCGSASSATRLFIPEPGKVFGYLEWVDVCKAWRTAVMAG